MNRKVRAGFAWAVVTGAVMVGLQAGFIILMIASPTPGMQIFCIPGILSLGVGVAMGVVARKVTGGLSEGWAQLLFITAFVITLVGKTIIPFLGGHGWLWSDDPSVFEIVNRTVGLSTFVVSVLSGLVAFLIARKLEGEEEEKQEEV